MQRLFADKDAAKLIKAGMGRILALDPGVTTGFSLYDQANPIDGRSWQQLCTHDGFIGELNEVWPNIIVMETFVHTHRTGVDYTPVEFIGLTKWFCERRSVVLIEQTPAYGKAFFDNDKLKRLGVYVPNKPHAMDASRHLYQFMMKSGIFDMRLLK